MSSGMHYCVRQVVPDVARDHSNYIIIDQDVDWPFAIRTIWTNAGKDSGLLRWDTACIKRTSCFGGLVVSMLASGTQDRGFKPSRSRQIFSGAKILSMPSFGREVKQFVPCHRFAARKRTLLDYVEVKSLRPNYSDVSRSKFPPSLTEGLQSSSRCAGAPQSAPTLE
jgi:hypothetical protein